MLSGCTESLMPETLEALDAGLAAAGRELVWRGALLRSHTGPFLPPEDAEWVEKNFHRFLEAFVERTHVIEGVPEPIIAALIDGLTFTGDVSAIPRIVQRLRSFQRCGQTAIALRLFDDPEQGLAMIGEQLLPALRSAG